MSTYNTTTVNLSTVRPVIVNGNTAQWDIQYPAGTSLRTGGATPWGYNLGVYEYYSVAEATTFAARLQSEGVQIVRLVGLNRWCGRPSKGSGDSRNIFSPPGIKVGLADACFNHKNPNNWNKLKTYVKAFTSLGIWVVICMEGDIRQSGTQDANGDPTSGTYDYGITLPQPGELIPGGLSDWGLAGGYNIFTSNFLFNQAREEAKMIANEFRSTPYIFAYELLSEPLPPAGTFPGNVPRQYIYPGSGNNGVYDSTWSSYTPGPGLGRKSIEEYYRTLIGDVMAIDPNTPFIIGGRGGYNLSPEMQEIITALSNPSSLSPGAQGNLVSAGKIIATWDRLGGGTSLVQKDAYTNNVAAGMNCPLFMNQLGERNASDNPANPKDPGDPLTYGLRAAVRCFRSFGIPGVIWDRRANGASGYGSEYSSGGADGDGANGNYTDVEPRRTDLSNVFQERFAALETAAQTAATAENAYLVYVKPDFSNVTVSSGSAHIGGTITGISPVIDGLATGLTFSAVGTVTLAYAWPDTGSSSYLWHKRPVLSISNASGSNYLAGNPNTTFYFGSTTTSGTSTGDENMACIVAGIPSSSATSQAFICLNNALNNSQYPKISSNANHKASLKLQSGGVGINVVGNNTLSDAGNCPMVITMLKNGNHPSTNVSLWVNGIDDTGYANNDGTHQAETWAGTGNTLTGQTIPAIGLNPLTQLQIGGEAGAGTFTGVLAGFCLFRQRPSDANAHAIGRFLSALMGGTYKA